MALAHVVLMVAAVVALPAVAAGLTDYARLVVALSLEGDASSDTRSAPRRHACPLRGYMQVFHRIRHHVIGCRKHMYIYQSSGSYIEISPVVQLQQQLGSIPAMYYVRGRILCSISQATIIY